MRHYWTIGIIGINIRHNSHHRRPGNVRILIAEFPPMKAVLVDHQRTGIPNIFEVRLHLCRYHEVANNVPSQQRRGSHHLPGRGIIKKIRGIAGANT